MPVQLPESSANALPQTPKAVTVTLTSDGKTFIDQDELAPGELPDRLGALMPRDGSPPPEITLRADRTLAYGEVMAVMGAMNHLGIRSIALVTSSSVPVP